MTFLSALISAALLLWLPPAMAQVVVVRQFQLHIPRQSLDGAVNEFVRQTGLQVARFADTVDGQAQAGPVDGVFSIQQALDALLAHSGLTYKLINDHTIAIVPAAARDER